jgi:competence protein ComEC
MKIFIQLGSAATLFLLTACGTADINNENEQPESTSENFDANAAEENSESSQENNENNEEKSNSSSNKQTASENNTENSVESVSSEDLKELEVHYIDAGQADASLLTFEDDDNEYNILFDSGNWNDTDVFDYLSANGTDSIDILIGSHPHADHIGQMDIILENLEVGEVWMSGDETESATFERVLDAVMASDASYEEPRAGESYEAGPLEIEIVNPDEITGDVHEGSLSAKFTYGNTSFLFTGDAESHTEEDMISRGHTLESDVLKLGHHGSGTSTSPSFLQEVDPRFAIVSAGENNQYGHPHAEVIERVENAGIDIYSTHIHGTIIVSSDGETLEVTSDTSGSVEHQEEAEEAGSDENMSSEQSGNNETASPEDCIDINSASIEELQQIHEVGAVRAGDIKDMRPFNDVEDLERVNGIGEVRLEEITSEGLACAE